MSTSSFKTALFVGLISVTAFALPKDLSTRDNQDLEKEFKYWESTKLSLDFLTGGTLSNQRCLKDRASLLDCFVFANQLGQQLKPQIVVLLKSQKLAPFSVENAPGPVIDYANPKEQGPLFILQLNSEVPLDSTKPPLWLAQAKALQNPTNADLVDLILTESRNKILPFQFLLELNSKIKKEDSMIVTEGRLNNERCFSNGFWLQGCVTAVNFVGAMTKPRTGLVFKSDLLKPPLEPLKNLKVLKEFGPFDFVEFLTEEEINNENSKNPDDKSIKAAMQKNRMVQLAYKKLYDNTAKKNLPAGISYQNTPFFAEVIHEMQAIGIDSDVPESYIAGNAYNLLLQKGLDPHSHIESVVEFEAASAGVSDGFVGIGVEVTMFNKTQILAKHVLPKGPALAAGLKDGDLILKIDGKTPQNLNEAVSWIRGPQRTQTKITCQRDGKELTFNIIRMPIQAPTVEARLLHIGNQSFGYIKLKSFVDEDAAELVRAEIKNLQKHQLKGMILDLRNNPGGFLHIATYIGAQFMDLKSPIVLTVERQTNQTKVFSSKKLQEKRYPNQSIAFDHETDLPLVVLIDAGSASASEILSGALKDYRRAWLVGDRTYGKGTAQGVLQHLTNPNLITMLTDAFFYHPSGESNQIVGVTPDFEVPPFVSMTEMPISSREGDQFLNALQAENIKSQIPEENIQKWEAQKQAGKKTIEDCIRNGQRAKAQALLTPTSDYQLLYATEVLSCDPGGLQTGRDLD